MVFPTRTGHQELTEDEPGRGQDQNILCGGETTLSINTNGHWLELRSGINLVHQYGGDNK